MPRQNRTSARGRSGQSRNRRNQSRSRRGTSARRSARQTGMRASRSVRARKSGTRRTSARTTRSRGASRSRTRAQAGRRGTQARRSQTRGAARPTTDHEQIQQWVEERGGWPATVSRSARGGEAGILRIDFPGYSGKGTLNPVSWDEWFRVFDENNLAFLHQERAAGGALSRFFKLVER